MIKSITLQNFQSHKNTTIAFCDGINAIVGLSDSGKTSILRAIDWVVNNKPSGEEFISSWSKETSVSITLDNGVVVKRGRTPSDNYYMIDDEVFRAFGVYVPVEVRNVMNMDPINIEKQMDPPFLLGNSPGEVAQILNQIVDLGGIDLAISNIRKEKMRADQAYRTEATRWEDNIEQLKQYDYLPAMERDVDSITAIMQQTDDSREKIKQINKLTKDIVYQKNLISELDCDLLFEAQIDHCQAQYDKLKINFRKKTAINTLLDAYNSHEQEIKKHELKIKNYLSIKSCSKLLNEIENNHKELKSIDNLIESHESTTKKITQCDKILKNGQLIYECLKFYDAAKVHRKKLKSINVLLHCIKSEKKKQTDQQAILEKLENKYHSLFPDSCPLCGVSK